MRLYVEENNIVYQLCDYNPCNFHAMYGTNTEGIPGV